MNWGRSTTLATAVVCWVMTAVTTAEARRAPSDAERAAVAQAIGVPPECALVSISTLDGAWALFEGTLPEDACPQGNGVIVLRQSADSGGYEILYEGAAGEPCPLRDVPVAVGEDLRACRRLSTRVYVPRGLRLAFKPRSLTYGAHAEITGLQWRQWGSVQTTAKGTLRYEDATTRFRAPVRVRLMRRRACGTRRTYLQLVLSFRDVADRRAYPALDGAIRLACP